MKISRKLRTGVYFSCLFLCAFLLLACGSKKSSTEAAPSVQKAPPQENRVVLQVGDVAYSEADLNKYIRDAAGTETQALEAATLSRLYDEFIQEKLFLEAAREKKITVSLAEKKEYLAKTADESWPEEEIKALVESDSGPLFDKMMVDKYIAAVVKDIKVDDDEIKRYYDLHKSEFFLPERVEVSQILVSTEAKAVEIWDKAKLASEEEYRNVATSESIGPEASQGGKMGVFQRGQLPQEWEEAIFALRESEVSPVIQSSYGFHIFRLDKKYEPEWTSLEQASPSIRLKLMDLKVKATVSRHLEDLKESLDWAALPENLSFTYLRIE
jgi:parvulin-like peptidyl-prolyl isomerase